MRTVKMLACDAGPAGVRNIGTTQVLDDREASALVDGGYARYLDVSPEETATVKPEEAPQVVPEETATHDRGRRQVKGVPR